MLNANNFKVAQIASAETSRYTLQAIQVTPDHTQATDGHRAIRVTTPKRYKCDDFPEIPGLQPTDQHAPFLLARADAISALKMLGNRKLKSGKDFPLCEYIAVGADTDAGESSHASFGLCVNKDLASKQKLQFEKEAGQFPNIDAVMPGKDEKPAQEFSFNADYLAEMLTLLSSMSDSRNNAMKIKWYKRGDSCLIVFEAKNSETEQTATAVIMGMRS